MFLTNIEGSPSLEVVNLVLQKRSLGEEVISLAIGDPESETPSEIVDAAFSAMKTGQVHYVPASGTPSARRAISNKVTAQKRNSSRTRRDNFLDYKVKRLCVSVCYL